MTRTKHIQGLLTPTNSKAVTEITREKILEAANKHGLGLVITNPLSDGVLDINSLSPAFGGSASVFGVLASLDNFLFSAGVKELGFEGSLTVTVITPTDSVVILMEVESSGRITYDRPHSHWKSDHAPQLVEIAEPVTEPVEVTATSDLPLVITSDECKQCAALLAQGRTLLSH